MTNTSYEPFSRQPEYIEVNRGFIRSLPLQPNDRVLDLACGTGTLGDLVWELGAGGDIIGLDLDRHSLGLAREQFNRWKPLERRGEFLFLEGTADCLPLKGQSVEVVLMGNSIHNLPDQGKLLREIHRVLKPDGLFAFNTSFFAGTFPPGTEVLYHEWLKLALGYIQAKDTELRNQGLPGIKRKRGTSHPAFSKKWPTPEEFSQLLLQHSFDVKWFCYRTVRLNQESLETVGAYGGLASVLLSGYPVELASEALSTAAAPAFAALNLTDVRRLWLEVVAQKQ